MTEIRMGCEIDLKMSHLHAFPQSPDKSLSMNWGLLCDK